MPKLSFTVAPQRCIARALLNAAASGVLPSRIDVALFVRLQR